MDRKESSRIDTAMVLAAGFGTRMRPLTERIPKPLVTLAGRALIDHALDRLAEANVARAVVNVHHLADQIEAHLRNRTAPSITISNERDAILETGGGVRKALPLLGSAPFLVHNSDSVWSEGAHSNLARLIQTFDEARMAALLLLAPRKRSLGYDGRGDFHQDATGRLQRRQKSEDAAYVFAGVSILHPRLFEGIGDKAFSLNVVFDRASAEAALYGMVLEGTWMHVGTPQALLEAEGYLNEGRRLTA